MRALIWTIPPMTPTRRWPTACPGCELALTQGFIARNDRGETVLLGRGGSDTSAAYFAAKLQAQGLGDLD
jgi:aspartokinase